MKIIKWNRDRRTRLKVPSNLKYGLRLRNKFGSHGYLFKKDFWEEKYLDKDKEEALILVNWKIKNCGKVYLCKKLIRQEKFEENVMSSVNVSKILLNLSTKES